MNAASCYQAVETSKYMPKKGTRCGLLFLRTSRRHVPLRSSKLYHRTLASNPDAVVHWQMQPLRHSSSGRDYLEEISCRSDMKRSSSDWKVSVSCLAFSRIVLKIDLSELCSKKGKASQLSRGLIETERRRAKRARCSARSMVDLWCACHSGMRPGKTSGLLRRK